MSSDDFARATLVTVLFLVLATWLACGCGASALQTQAQANLVVGDALTEAHGVVVEHIDGEIAGCLRLDGPDADRDRCLERTEARWQPVDDAQRIAADAHRAWSDALIAAVQAGETEMEPSSALGLVAAVVRAYRSLVEAAADVGLQLPALPEVVP